MSLVVRCPACLGESRVDSGALGLMVACPRCEVPFVAAEEVVPVVQPVARPRSGGRATTAVPVEAPRRRPRPLSPEGPAPIPEPAAEVHPVPDPEHDPHLPPPAGLPVSVLVGLALLPLAIPVFWWAAPIVTGHPAALSLAVPLSLAFAASTLCLGVVYTIDWSAATRIKGVLMLVGLAYLAAAGLFFLKKNLVDRVQKFGGAGISWQHDVELDGTSLRMPSEPLKLPNESQPAVEQPIPKVVMVTGWRASYESEIDDTYHYLILSGRLNEPVKPDAAWFDAVGDHLARSGKITAHTDVPLNEEGHRCREWTLQADNNKARVVRVYVIDTRVYYLSVEGRNVDPTDRELVVPFFHYFNFEKPTGKLKNKAKR